MTWHKITLVLLSNINNNVINNKAITKSLFIGGGIIVLKKSCLDISDSHYMDTNINLLNKSLWQFIHLFITGLLTVKPLGKFLCGHHASKNWSSFN